MRTYQYELICRQEALDMYNVAKDLGNRGIPSDDWAWSGTHDGKPVSSSYARAGSLVTKESKVSGTPNWAGEGNASCAISACRVNMNICAEFGHPFIKEYSNCPNARLMHGKTLYHHEDMSLKKLIEEGHVGPGTMLSRPRNWGEENRGSGYHALTVADVVRDEEGKITHVIIQGNNSNTLDTYSVEEIDEALRAKAGPDRRDAPFVVTSTHEWARSVIAEEVGGYSLEDLQRRNVELNAQLRGNISVLSQIETNALALGGNYGMAIEQEICYDFDYQKGEADNFIYSHRTIEQPDELMGRADLSSVQGVAMQNLKSDDFGTILPAATVIFDKPTGHTYVTTDKTPMTREELKQWMYADEKIVAVKQQMPQQNDTAEVNPFERDEKGISTSIPMNMDDKSRA